ncbi:MAG: hypothetical protein CMJ64_18765 [Planctomycetaceae bacterium]|jgi:HPt (histidine-containing phosphotransfer) domain-containing protein|nr:hypothetical protein [Planctomycetaceae bacterium]
MTEPEKARLIDWQVGLDATGGNQALLCELITIFFDEYPKQLAGIREAIESRSGKELRRFAHTLKGCLRYFGDSKAGSLASDLEVMAADDIFDNGSGLLEDLRLEVERLLPELREYLDEHQ